MTICLSISNLTHHDYGLLGDCILTVGGGWVLEFNPQHFIRFHPSSHPFTPGPPSLPPKRKKKQGQGQHQGKTNE
jgi:hypothetical protein